MRLMREQLVGEAAEVSPGLSAAVGVESPSAGGETQRRTKAQQRDHEIVQRLFGERPSDGCESPGGGRAGQLQRNFKGEQPLSRCGGKEWSLEAARTAEQRE